MQQRVTPKSLIAENKQRDYGRVQNMHQPLCIDYPNVTSRIRESSTKTYIKWINMIPHCHHEYSIARHISTVLKSIKIFNPITKKSQREKLDSSQQDREGKTPYDSTILTKPAIHQDRDISRRWEREIKHIATGTNPQPRGWTSPSSWRWPPGWWRWPPEMISPSARVPERGLDWFSVTTKPCGGGTFDLG